MTDVFIVALWCVSTIGMWICAIPVVACVWSVTFVKWIAAKVRCMSSGL